MNAELEDGRISLFLACIKGHTEIARLLLDRGANPNALDDNENTILDIVCPDYFDPALAQLLVDSGADVDRRNFVNDNGSTLLHWACWSGNVRIAQFLLENGADIYIKNKFSCIPFDYVRALSAPGDEKNDLIALFKEYDPEAVLETALEMEDGNKFREELLAWFQENRPELYFSTFCTTNISPGGM